ncbi:hypothetical protein CAPTEDRAFT_201732 [Capitella teleta]|uniref:SUEL-type lectin domain-containing protein n=1 Tax=Capitella teleta TaxID=283909 RepID=R7U115_CAPTE|nr:hypothetical protein CAPTEDRAFT_201732 [Capitella teleta]|eukprot:ELT99577.1 hypothetical protein CAPTEDRAFT_201732 [Capitella teleta]
MAWFLLLSLFVCVEGRLVEVCYFSAFNARCPPNQVIVMESAMFGRMRPGVCYSDSDGEDFSRCTTNVLNVADKYCSGKTQCEIQIPNQDIEDNMLCEGMKGYFSASYDCLSVVNLNSICQLRQRALQITNDVQYISSADLSSAYCARQQGNVVLQAKPGQQINVTLMDFTWGMPSSSGCTSFGTISDYQTGRTRSICGGQTREEEVMLSISSTVLITPPDSGSHRFLYRVQALGCEDFIAPPGAWMNRSSDEVFVGCLGNRDTWHLRCYQGRWNGNVGKCPYAPTQPDESPVHRGNSSLPNDVIIAMIAAATFLLAVIIVTVGIIYFKRAQRRQNVLQQQQKQVFLTLSRRKMAESMEDSTYMSPDIFQREPAPSHRPDSAYESIHPLLNRTLPPPPQAALNNAPPPREDIYNTSQSSSSTYAHPQKYVTLDKNVMQPPSVVSSQSG